MPAFDDEAPEFLGGLSFFRLAAVHRRGMPAVPLKSGRVAAVIIHAIRRIRRHEYVGNQGLQTILRPRTSDN